jgi:hypothetical protein
MNIDKKILEELRRINQINSYILNEQDPLAGGDPAAGGADPLAGGDPAAAGGAPAPGGDPAAGGTPAPGGDPAAAGGAPAPGGEEGQPIDIENDPDVEVVDEPGTESKDKEEGQGETEEIDITDLVTAQQEIKDKQDEIMDNLFGKLDDLQSKLSNMDQILNKIQSLETKFDRYREKTPEEKLMLRSLDSYPYNQKLTDFFDDKKQDMEETGKNEYILTSDEVENFSPNEIKKTFNTFDEEEEKLKERYYRRNKRIL